LKKRECVNIFKMKAITSSTNVNVLEILNSIANHNTSSNDKIRLQALNSACKVAICNEIISLQATEECFYW
jgi:hypothetical protein